MENVVNTMIVNRFFESEDYNKIYSNVADYNNEDHTSWEEVKKVINQDLTGKPKHDIHKDEADMSGKKVCSVNTSKSSAPQNNQLGSPYHEAKNYTILSSFSKLEPTTKYILAFYNDIGPRGRDIEEMCFNFYGEDLCKVTSGDAKYDGFILIGDAIKEIADEFDLIGLVRVFYYPEGAKGKTFDTSELNEVYFEFKYLDESKKIDKVKKLEEEIKADKELLLKKMKEDIQPDDLFIVVPKDGHLDDFTDLITVIVGDNDGYVLSADEVKELLTDGELDPEDIDVYECPDYIKESEEPCPEIDDFDSLIQIYDVYSFFDVD